MTPSTVIVGLQLGIPYYKDDSFWIMVVMISIMLFLVLMYFYLRRKFVREIAYRKNIARSYEKALDLQRTEMRKKEEELHRQRIILENTKAELDLITKEIETYKIKLSEKEKLLEEKIKQNKSFMRLLHQTELEGNAKDIVDAVKKASNGQYEMSDVDWKMLLQAVDELYPSFNDQLIRKIGRIDRQELRVCYLIRIGLTNPQIQNIMNLPRTTVWRWTKKYEWISDM